VWFGAKNQDKWYFYPIALLIHFAVDAVAGTLAMMKANTILIEALLYVMSTAVVAFALMVWKKNAPHQKV
jgi:hypothetical protein